MCTVVVGCDSVYTGGSCGVIARRLFGANNATALSKATIHVV